MDPPETTPVRKARRVRSRIEPDRLPARRAVAARLTDGANTTRLDAKVTTASFEAVARQDGSESAATVVVAAPAALATQDGLGPWLAAAWGSLADVDPALLEEIDL